MAFLKSVMKRLSPLQDKLLVVAMIQSAPSPRKMILLPWTGPASHGQRT